MTRGAFWLGYGIVILVAVSVSVAAGVSGWTGVAITCAAGLGWVVFAVMLDHRGRRNRS